QHHVAMPDLSRTLRSAFTRVLNRRAAVRRGRVDVVRDFESKLLGNKRQLTIYTPPGYDDRVDRRYPVLYMQDGQNLFDNFRAFAGQAWRLREAADDAIGARSMSPAIIVGVDHTHADRVHEYAPTRDIKRAAGGKADDYAQMLLEELKPVIDATYRTLIDHTAVGGSSLGGLVSMHLLLMHPDVFHGGIVMSPSVWWDNRAILKEVDRYAAPQHPRIWLDIGGREGREAIDGARALRDRLRAKGWNDHTLRYFEDRRADHSERSWGARVRKALEFLFPPE
ncbi:MAG TPA: alpha/beta hydrolase-fold protein, partial [Thermoanaerobaculia bacterium]|nr:alpha/beta hydrolase-fold protein [Thermoanaerobaculia bacterium]